LPFELQWKPAGQVFDPPGVHMSVHADGAGCTVQTLGNVFEPQAATTNTANDRIRERSIAASYPQWYGNLRVLRRRRARRVRLEDIPQRVHRAAATFCVQPNLHVGWIEHVS
jgi:hypothetical protein